MGGGASLPTFLSSPPKSEYKKNFHGRYDLVSDLGTGAFSVVKLGKDKVSVAILFVY